MKIRELTLFATTALLLVPTTGFAALINGDVADQFVGGPSSPGPQDANGTSVGNIGGSTLKVGRVGGTGVDNTNGGRNAVYVFELPNLGAIPNPFSSASLSFGVAGIDANTAVDADLYGLSRRDATPSIVVADYYFGNAADPTDATRLQTTILTPTTTPNSIVVTDATGSANLMAFLNAQYDGGAGAGQFVYLRLNVDGGLTAVRGYNVHTANDPDPAKRPTIEYTAVPEPASLALFAAAGVALAWGRRRSR
jgi:hypothetical protein